MPKEKRRSKESTHQPYSMATNGMTARIRARHLAAHQDHIESDRHRLGLGEPGSGHAGTDISDLLDRPLESGSDGRGYITRPVRVSMERRIEASDTHLDAAPAFVRGTVERLRAGGNPIEDFDSRDHNAHTGERVVATRFDAGVAEARERRTGADTHDPGSPSPPPDREWARHERAHFIPHAYGHDRPATHHAPTQINQAAHPALERFASAIDGGVLIHRIDSREASAWAVSGDHVRSVHYNRLRDPYPSPQPKTPDQI